MKEQLAFIFQPLKLAEKLIVLLIQIVIAQRSFLSFFSNQSLKHSQRGASDLEEKETGRGKIVIRRIDNSSSRQVSSLRGDTAACHERNREREEMAILADQTFFSYAILSVFLLSSLTFLSLQFLQAPYGKHSRSGWGPSISPSLAWFLMESPTLWFTVLLYPLGQNRSNPTSVTLISFFLLHYFHRTVIYPLRLKTTRRPTQGPSRKIPQDSGRFPLVIALLAFIYNIFNTYLQVRWVSHYGNYGEGWLVSLPFLVGSAVFLAGMMVNIWSDSVLFSLKGKGGYHIPAGGVFELVSCGNYFGELVEWLGWAILTWSWAGFGFFLYTCANLGPRAVAHHRWYLKQFPDDYPKSRKAIIPFLC